MPLFTRREYREDYLKHDQHWQTLRGMVLTEGVKCFKCRNRPGTDPHHMRYGRIYDVHKEDLVALCRPCHELIEKAKRLRCIPKEHERRDVLAITEEKIKEILAHRRSKVEIPLGLLERIQRTPSLNKQRACCGVMKCLPPRSFLDWSGVKVSRAVLGRLIWTMDNFRVKERAKPWQPKRFGSSKRPVHY